MSGRNLRDFLPGPGFNPGMVRRIRQEATESAMRGNHIGGPILRLMVCFAAVVIITALLFLLPIPRDRLLSAALNVFLIVVVVVSVRWSTGYGIFLSLLFALAFSLSLPPAGHFHLEDARVWTLMTGCLVTGLVSGELSRRVRKEAQHARLSEKELRDVIETIPAMSWSALPDGSNTFVSGRWTEYTGLTTEDSAGLGWQTAVHPEDLARHVERWSTSLRTGQPFEDEARYCHRTNGEYRWYLVRAVPVRNQQGDIVKWFGALTDIEDRKRAEEGLRDLARINRVNIMAELAASLAHEIKQPIAAAATDAATCLRWLQRQPPETEQAREASSRVIKESRRAAEIVDRVRSLYSRGDRRQELVDVNALIDEMIEVLSGEASRYSISIHGDLARNLPKVIADRVQLQQVFMNLMLNGIEAMKGTAGQLTITSRPAADGQVVISISDSGVGLPTEKTDQIFDAFFTTKPNGTGMGLAITRRIIEAHGGRLSARANPDRGATFEFTWPTERAAHA